MKANRLEQTIVNELLRDPELSPLTPAVDLAEVKVTDRELTGAGFLTEFERCQALKLFPDGTSLRWGSVGVRLNAEKLETGYVVYVDDGYLTTIEGYTYGDEWPATIDAMEVYEVKLETAERGVGHR